MTEPAESAPKHDLKDLVQEGGEEIPSITGVHGTVAHFEMAYSASLDQRAAFGPPMITRVPSFVYLAFSLGLVGIVIAAHTGSHNSPLYRWIVEGDRGRPLSAAVLSFIVFASALATIARTFMRGVVVHRDGIEGRYILPLGIPKIRRYAWPQIDRIVIDEKRVPGARPNANRHTTVMLELWDNTYEHLPEVADEKGLAQLLEAIANARKIRLTKL